MEQNHCTLNEFSGVLVGPALNVLFDQFLQFRFQPNVHESSLSQFWHRSVFLARKTPSRNVFGATAHFLGA
jgi:hypothetical protein